MGNFSECETVNRPYLLGTHYKTGDCVLYRPDCKLWSCPHCANVKAKQWASRVRACVLESEEKSWFFMTMTIKDESGNLERQIEIWRKAWDVFSKRLRRACGRDLTYVAVPELSPVEKRLHCHMILDWHCQIDLYPHEYIDKNSGEKYKKEYSSWLHKHLVESGLGYIYDIQQVNSPNQAAYYMTKYIGKGLSEVFPKGFRRVRTSQGFPEIMPDEAAQEFEWIVLPYSEAGRGILLLEMFKGKKIQDAKTKQPIDMKHELIVEFMRKQHYSVSQDTV